jgi:hypothetical protein
MYASVSYTVPLAVIGQKPIFLLASRLVTFDMFSDICKIGDAAIYTTPGNVKASLGAGVNYHVIFLKNFPLKLGVSIAKAFENRPAYLYFSITTAYYTWRS